MRNRMMKVAQALCLSALAGIVSVASADMITIDDFDDPLPGDFVIDIVRDVNGNCADNDTDCLALNTGESSTLSRAGGESFTLDSFWFQMLGSPSQLRVTTSNADVYNFFSDLYGTNDGGQTVTNGDEVLPIGSGVFLDFTDITSLTWTGVDGRGNSRIDDLMLAFTVIIDECPPGTTGTPPNNCVDDPDPDPDPDPEPVPEPGTLGLLGLGLLGLSLRRRREV